MTTSWKPILISSTGVLVFVGALVLMTPSPAAAQCGSQASSCKNCHEVQGQLPVNSIGDWHISHAFGDFCQFCHAGNVQAMEAETAHQSMVAPLADPVASCGACHPTDAQDLAVVYGTALGVEVGAGGGGPAATAPTAATQPTLPAAVDVAASLPAADIIDYNTQYAQTVEGQGELQPGNLILGALIVLIVLGGGGFVLRNERRRLMAAPAAEAPTAPPAIPEESQSSGRGVPHSETQAPPTPAKVPEQEISALLQALDPAGRGALGQLLQDAETASDLFRRLARLDPNMLRTLRSLDQNTRELLLALSKD